MKIKKEAILSLFLVAAAGAASVNLSGCAAAVVGAAGVVGGVAYTDRGAKGDIRGNVAQVNEAAKEALQDMKIRVTGSEMAKSGKEKSLEGKSTKADVSVKMTQGPSEVTHVEVIAREGTVHWNKDYAREILAKIASR